MNVLILTAGSRVLTVRSFQEALAGAGKVIATDASPYAPALYAADGHHVVPLITDPAYLDTIAEICREEEISLMLSLLDPELSMLAAHRGRFEQLGVHVMVSPAEVVERAFDKWEMYRWLREHDYSTPTSWVDPALLRADLDAGAAELPLFVKSRTGSASAGIARIDTREALEEALAADDGLIVQEFMPGSPVDVDVYVDMISGQAVSLFAKKKLRMRAGTADKTVSFKDEALFELVSRFVEECGFRGTLDVDLFSTAQGWSILEVNPRFGGVYPHAHACGLDFPSMALNNARGIENPKRPADYEEGWAMLAYDAVIMHRFADRR